MPRPLRLEFPNAIWHLTNRGVDRQDIFFTDSDRRFFLDLLADIVQRLAWIVYAWIEMTNHYHLLIQTPFTNLSRGMKDLDGDFAREINRRRGRVGHLFQGRFRGILVQRETHLLAAIRYVVLNPVRAGMVQRAEEWHWSSYGATAGLEIAPTWLDVDSTLKQFHSSDRRQASHLYREFVAAGAEQKSRLWDDLRSGLYLGDEKFAAHLEELAAVQRDDFGYSVEQRNPWRPALEVALEAAADVFDLPLTLRCDRTIVARKLFAWVARSRCGAPVADIAAHLGVSPSGASKLIAAGRELSRRNAYLKTVDALDERLQRSRPQQER